MALYDSDEDLLLDGQCPCEFCGELFPFEILIEHQTGCNPDLTSFGVEDYDFSVPTQAHNVVENILASEVEKVKIEIRDANQNKPKTEDIVKSAPKTTLTDISPKKFVPKKTEEKIQTNPGPKFNFMNELKQDKKFQQRHSEQYKDDISSYTGERLMSFGSAAAAATKEYDSEKEENHDSGDEVEDVEDINNLSDDDCSETLEEFWKRARDFLKRQRVKNI